MSTKTLTALEAEAREAAERFQAAQDAAEQAREAERQRQAERARHLDEQIVADYDEQRHFRAAREARQEFDRAVAASDLGKAWINLKVAQARHTHAAEERNSAAARLGRHDDRVQMVVATNAAFEEIGKAVDRNVANVIADEIDARDAAREAAVTGR
ncbi:MAG: hypothetical protein M3P89_02085 [Actinomycetota bacterium]|nr:hypothetical protein [Actinomycetota bacterium]